MLEHAEKYATQYGCCQFEFMGNRYVSIFDPCLAKTVLRDIQGKGKLHEGDLLHHNNIIIILYIIYHIYFSINSSNAKKCILTGYK